MRTSIHTREYKALTKWLKEKRLEAGLSLRQLGELLEVHHSIVGKVEICERRLDLVEYLDYCQALGINPLEGIKIMLKAQ